MGKPSVKIIAEGWVIVFLQHSVAHTPIQVCIDYSDVYFIHKSYVRKSHVIKQNWTHRVKQLIRLRPIAKTKRASKQIIMFRIQCTIKNVTIRVI